MCKSLKKNAKITTTIMTIIVSPSVYVGIFPKTVQMLDF